jgi:hypothetical protein
VEEEERCSTNFVEDVDENFEDSVGGYGYG